MTNSTLRSRHKDSVRTVAFRLISAGILAAMLTLPVSAKTEKTPAPPLPYAVVADQANEASAIAHVRIRSITAVPPERSAGLRKGEVRYYAEADSNGLIRGQSGVARRISFLIDAPAGKSAIPVVKGREYLLFGSIGERIDQFRLTSSKAILPWNGTNEVLTRKIVTEMIAPGAPPAISRIESAFHVAGAVTGESESQIFLQTIDKRPISLSIVRRPDESPAFSVAIGEVAGGEASLPDKDTLLWYRLACYLPASLPAAALLGSEASDATAARSDYIALLTALSPCNR